MIPNPAVLLRPALKSDFKILAGLRRDARLQHLLLGYPAGKRPSDAAVRRWIARRSDDPGGCFLVVAGGGGRAIGFVQVHDVHRAGGFGKIGIALAPAARGKGYGEAALNRLIDYAGETLNLRKLMLEVRADNEPAIALFRRAGFRRVGTLRAHYWDGERWHDVVLMERIG